MRTKEEMVNWLKGNDDDTQLRIFRYYVDDSRYTISKNQPERWNSVFDDMNTYEIIEAVANSDHVDMEDKYFRRKYGYTVTTYPTIEDAIDYNGFAQAIFDAFPCGDTVFPELAQWFRKGYYYFPYAVVTFDNGVPRELRPSEPVKTWGDACHILSEMKQRYDGNLLACWIDKEADGGAVETLDVESCSCEDFVYNVDTYLRKGN